MAAPFDDGVPAVGVLRHDAVEVVGVRDMAAVR